MNTINIPALRDLLGQHGASKPEAWADIPMVQKIEDRVEFLKALGAAPSFTERELYGSVGKHHCALDFLPSFTGNLPQFFYITRDDGQAFLVNTEGYNYAREVIRVL